MPNPVVHFEIQSNKQKEVQKFYADLFDWHVEEQPQMEYGMVDTHTDPKGINGGIGGTNGGPNRVTFYVEVADLQAALDKAEKLGGKTVMPPMDIPDAVSMAMFSDPEGNVVGLVKEDSM